MKDDRFAVARLSEIDRTRRGEWIPLRRHFGIQAFGVNAWSGEEEGAQLISEHDETSIAHEELYVVMEGRATFTVDGEEIDAPAGTAVFVRDPAVRRKAVVRDGRTTILTVGAKPGEAFRVSPWEENADIIELFERGEFAAAEARLLDALERHPENPGLLYNLACAEARQGRGEDALEHLRRSVELDARFAEYAQGDEDLESIREDPRFPKAETTEGGA